MITDFNNFFELKHKLKNFEKKLETLNNLERTLNSYKNNNGYVALMTKDFTIRLDELQKDIESIISARIEKLRQNLIAENNLILFNIG